MVSSLQVIEKNDFTELRKCYVIKINSLFSITYKHKTIEWEAKIINRSNGTDCPECAGTKVGKDNNLFVKFPQLSKEWHKTKNGDLTPKNVTLKSGKKVWWECNKGHEWEAQIINRSNGTGCPECSGRKAGKDNSLFVKFPQLSKEWHKTKNKDLTPKDITPGSNKKVWWKCKKKSCVGKTNNI